MLERCFLRCGRSVLHQHLRISRYGDLVFMLRGLLMTRDIIRFYGSCEEQNKLLLGNLRTNREQVIFPSSQSKIKKKILSSLANHFSVILPSMLYVYVIAWARWQLRLNFTHIFKVFRKIWKTLKMQVKLILNCSRALAITRLSHKRQNFCRHVSRAKN